MTDDTEETQMARTGTPSTTPDSPASEPEVDFMADAPAARPYADAITPGHRELLTTAGITVPDASPAA